MACASARLAPAAARAVAQTLFVLRPAVGSRCIASARTAGRAARRDAREAAGLGAARAGTASLGDAHARAFARRSSLASAASFSTSFVARAGDRDDKGGSGSGQIEDLPSSPPFPGTPHGLRDTIAPESPLRSPAPHFTAHSEAEWRDVDAKVNEYPLMRSFVAVGTGGEAFVTDVAAVVGRVLGREVGGDAVSSRPSKRGTYVSATVGPVRVDTPDQVVEIFRALKGDPRLKFYL